MDFTKQSVDDIRAELVKSGLSKEDADLIKGKSNLVAKWKQLNPKETTIDLDFNPNKEVNTEELTLEAEEKGGKEVVVRPDRTSVLWHEYVMSQFAPDELVKDPKSGNELPSVDGLRRVTELLIGEIVTSVPTSCKTPYENDKTATVQYNISIRVDSSNPYILNYGGMADANYTNTDGDYKKHLSSIAETRAEGKALRKALGLKKIVAAEEIAPSSTDEFVPEEFLTDMQLIMMEKLCKENDINILKFINSGQTKYAHYSKVPRQKGGEMAGYLNEYARGAISIPETIKGYDSNWRN